MDEHHDSTQDTGNRSDKQEARDSLNVIVGSDWFNDSSPLSGSTPAFLPSTGSTGSTLREPLLSSSVEAGTKGTRVRAIDVPVPPAV